MTDDLVKQLRKRTDPTQMLLTDPPQPARDRLCWEAASRIEQLETALQKISDLDCYIDDGKQFHIGYFGEIARAALGEKKDG